jgi:hypothetical protein
VDDGPVRRAPNVEKRQTTAADGASSGYIVNLRRTSNTSRIAPHRGVRSKTALHALGIRLQVGLRRGSGNGGRKESEGSGGGELHRELNRVRGARDDDDELELSWTGKHSNERQQDTEKKKAEDGSYL